MSDYPDRPQTPQAMLHRLPDKPEFPSSGARNKPSKYVILIVASTAVAGKAQIATSVADALSCPLFQGDSLHETSARAATMSSSAAVSQRSDAGERQAAPEPNKERYQRMWLSKMTRTGYLFPDESRPANEGFSGFGGGAPAPSSTSTSRRGPSSSVASASGSSGISNVNSYVFTGGAPGAARYINKPPPTVTLSEDEKLRKANPALMVVTHPVLEQWHKDSIRHVVGEYGIAVIFVPLDEDDEDEDLPVLKPLDPRTMTSFASLGSLCNAQTNTAGGSLDDEIVLSINVASKVEDLIEDIVHGVRDIMNV
ncbi:hypothetical protein N0V82_009529 [Gnomoniopsis sp. IMI 355080]|nr:hypothetical protein N0V82_009529 [Gnomoniopsis sp. IMI 355080]